MAVFVALAGVWWLQTVVRSRPRRGADLPLLGPLVVVLPFGAGWLWQRYADSLKAFDFNPLDVGPRLPPAVPGLDRRPPRPALPSEHVGDSRESAIPDAVGHPVVLAVAALCVLVAGRRRAPFALGLVAFLAHFLIFTPLDVSHTYYLYAAGLYLVAAVGFAAVGLLETGDGRRHLAWLLTAVVVVSFTRGYVTRMLPLQQEDAYRKPSWIVRLANAIDEGTGPDDVIVGFGLGWDPEVAYYAKRRAVMWPGWADPRPDSPDVVRTLANLDPYTVGAFFNCFHGLPPETLTLFLEHWGLQESRRTAGGASSTSDPPHAPSLDVARRDEDLRFVPPPPEGLVSSLVEGERGDTPGSQRSPFGLRVSRTARRRGAPRRPGTGVPALPAPATPRPAWRAPGPTLRGAAGRRRVQGQAPSERCGLPESDSQGPPAS